MKRGLISLFLHTNRNIGLKCNWRGGESDPAKVENRYNATIICPDGKEIVIPIESSFDMVKGLYLPILYTVATSGWGILEAFPSSLIDYYSDNAYSVNEIVLPVSCVY